MPAIKSHHTDTSDTTRAAEMETKDFRFELHQADDAKGEITGVAAVYGVEDMGADIIARGAFTKTLQDRPEVPLLWQHDPEKVIGMSHLEDTGKRLLIRAQLDMDDPDAQRAFRKIKKGLITGLSIGFNTLRVIREELEDRIVRHIEELKLWEISIVTFPMMPQAQVTSVKHFRPSVDDTAEASKTAEVTSARADADEASGAETTSDEPACIHSALQLRQTLKGGSICPN